MLRRRSLSASGALLACTLASGGCGAAPAPVPSAGPAPAPAKASAAPQTGFGRFPRTWEVKLGSEVNKIVIHKDSVITIGTAGIERFSRSDGRSLERSRDGCLALVAEVAGNKLTVICSTDIRSIDLESLEAKTEKSFPSTAVAAALSRDEIAVEHMIYAPRANGQPSTRVEIVVLDRATLAEKRQLAAQEGYAISLAANGDGLLVAVFPNGVELNRSPSAAWRHLVKGGDALLAVPSPSGRHVFFSSPTVGSMAVDVATAGVVRGWRGATASAAAWIGDEAVVTVGAAEGIRVLELTGQEAVSPHETPLSAVAVAEDDSGLCAHSLQAARLYCYFDL